MNRSCSSNTIEDTSSKKPPLNLGIGLIGQVVVSRDLVARLGVKVMKSVGVCTEMDAVMHRMLRKHPKCWAVVYRAKLETTPQVISVL